MKLKIMENALKVCPNRFQLSMMAAARAKEINSGDSPAIETDGVGKPVVVALEEISVGKVIPASLEEMREISEARRKRREQALIALREAEAAMGLEGQGEGEEEAAAVPDKETLS